MTQPLSRDRTDPTKKVVLNCQGLDPGETAVIEVYQSGTLLPVGLFASPIRGATFPASADRVGQLFYHDTYGLCKSLDTAGNWAIVDVTKTYMSLGAAATGYNQADLAVRSTFNDLAVMQVIDGPSGRYLWTAYKLGSVSTPASPIQKGFASATSNIDLELVVANLVVKMDNTTSASSSLRLKSVPASMSVTYFSNVTAGSTTRRNTLTNAAYVDPDSGGNTESLTNNTSLQFVVATEGGMYEITAVRGTSNAETYLSVLYIPA